MFSMANKFIVNELSLACKQRKRQWFCQKKFTRTTLLKARDWEVHNLFPSRLGNHYYMITRWCLLQVQSPNIFKIIYNYNIQTFFFNWNGIKVNYYELDSESSKLRTLLHPYKQSFVEEQQKSKTHLTNLANYFVTPVQFHTRNRENTRPRLRCAY